MPLKYSFFLAENGLRYFVAKITATGIWKFKILKEFNKFKAQPQLFKCQQKGLVFPSFLHQIWSRYFHWTSKSIFWPNKSKSSNGLVVLVSFLI